MYRELVSLGPVTIHTFGAMMALGFMASLFVLDRMNKRFSVLPPGCEISGVMMNLLLAGIAGARICHVVEYWHQDGFDKDWLSIFMVWNGGLVFYGGFAGAVAAFLAMYFRRRGKIGFFEFSDFILVALPLGHAFGRLGCFFNGCCFGRLASECGRAGEIFGLSFPPLSDASYTQWKAGLLSSPALKSLPVLPSQLFEASALLLLFAILLLAYLRFHGRRPGVVTGLYFCGYGVFRFCLEYMRGDDRPANALFSSAQMFSMPLVAVGAVFALLALKNRLRRRKADCSRD